VRRLTVHFGFSLKVLHIDVDGKCNVPLGLCLVLGGDHGEVVELALPRSKLLAISV
jgi:hypothetical protein